MPTPYPAEACRVAPRTRSVPDLLVNLLDDLNPGVAMQAAKALGGGGGWKPGPFCCGGCSRNRTPI